VDPLSPISNLSASLLPIPLTPSRAAVILIQSILTPAARGQKHPTHNHIQQQYCFTGNRLRTRTQCIMIGTDTNASIAEGYPSYLVRFWQSTAVRSNRRTHAAGAGSVNPEGSKFQETM
jgi:hypothetical protein